MPQPQINTAKIFFNNISLNSEVIDLIKTSLQIDGGVKISIGNNPQKGKCIQINVDTFPAGSQPIDVGMALVTELGCSEALTKVTFAVVIDYQDIADRRPAVHCDRNGQRNSSTVSLVEKPAPKPTWRRRPDGRKLTHLTVVN